jgi:hypothetical protein
MVAEAAPLAVGDVVEWAEPVAHIKAAVGSHGTVLVDGLPWGMLTVVFGRDPDQGRPYLVHARHLRRLADGEAPGA